MLQSGFDTFDQASCFHLFNYGELKALTHHTNGQPFSQTYSWLKEPILVKAVFKNAAWFYQQFVYRQRGIFFHAGAQCTSFLASDYGLCSAFKCSFSAKTREIWGNNRLLMQLILQCQLKAWKCSQWSSHLTLCKKGCKNISQNDKMFF